MRRFKSSFTIGIVPTFLFLVPATAHGQTAMAVFEKVKESVFVVKSFDAKGAQKSLGSAVLLPNGKFATNWHVLEEGVQYQVGRGERFVEATLYAGDSTYDIGLLSASGIPGKAVDLGRAADLKIGQAVFAVGAPQGLELSISEGIVSQLRGSSPPIVQTTAAITPGSSGGGLFDAQGKLVGLTTLYIEDGQNLNFAMPVEWITQVKPGVVAGVRKRSIGAWLARAEYLFQRGDGQGLLSWCLEWTKSEPTNSNAWALLASAYQFNKRHGEAADAYRQALQIDPEFGFVWSLLGGSLMRLKSYDEAAKAFRRALDIYPEDGIAWEGLGDVYYSLGRYKDCAVAYREAVRINPDKEACWISLGWSYHALQRYSEAVDAFRRGLSINPEKAEA